MACVRCGRTQAVSVSTLLNITQTTSAPSVSIPYTRLGRVPCRISTPGQCPACDTFMTFLLTPHERNDDTPFRGTIPRNAQSLGHTETIQYPKSQCLQQNTVLMLASASRLGLIQCLFSFSSLFLSYFFGWSDNTRKTCTCIHDDRL